MAITMYTVLLRLFAPLIWLWMGWRARRAGGQWQIFAPERFGASAQPWDGEPPVWVHAVSLGETRASQSLVSGLIAAGDRVLLTHMTATGRAEGARIFAAEIASGQLRQEWLPYDFPGATKKFFNHYRPRLGILIEREVWPNLVAQSKRLGVPLVLASARFGVQALKHVRQIDRLFGSLMHDAYASLSLILAQTQEDAARLFEAGGTNIKVSGNLKFDAQLPLVAVEAGHAWRAKLNRPLISIASTREGEDAMFVSALAATLLPTWSSVDAEQAVQPARQETLFLLIPRHPQRFDLAADLLEQAGIAFVRWSVIRHDVQAKETLGSVRVVLCDTLGEMPFFYAASDVAIVAGSFAPLGGQNLIEACAVGTPVIVGPFTHNFKDAVQGAVQAGAAIQLATSELVDPAARAVSTALEWLNDQQALEQRAQAAKNWVAQHTGAAHRMLEEITCFQDERVTP